MVRPSESSTVSRSAEITSVVTRTCCVSTVEEVIPRIHQLFVMISHTLLNPPKLLCREASATFEADRIEPNLRLTIVAFHMYMRRFIAVAGVVEETIRSNSQDCGHGCFAGYVLPEEGTSPYHTKRKATTQPWTGQVFDTRRSAEEARGDGFVLPTNIVPTSHRQGS